jgi:Leucine-rich repeat (LRR) protein
MPRQSGSFTHSLQTLIEPCSSSCLYWPLEAMYWLKGVSVFFYMRIPSLKPLMNCLNLEWLDLHKIDFSDLSPLSACVNLRRLDLYRTFVNDLSPLRKCVKLQWLMINSDTDDGVSEISDISPLSSLTQLKFLNIQHTHTSLTFRP